MLDDCLAAIECGVKLVKISYIMSAHFTEGIRYERSEFGIAPLVANY